MRNSCRSRIEFYFCERCVQQIASCDTPKNLVECNVTRKVAQCVWDFLKIKIFRAISQFHFMVELQWTETVSIRWLTKHISKPTAVCACKDEVFHTWHNPKEIQNKPFSRQMMRSGLLEALLLAFSCGGLSSLWLAETVQEDLGRVTRCHLVEWFLGDMCLIPLYQHPETWNINNQHALHSLRTPLFLIKWIKYRQIHCGSL